MTKKESKKKKPNDDPESQKRVKPSGGVDQVVKDKSVDNSKELSMDIHYTCKDCGWSFSLSRNKACPMCKTKPELDLGFLIARLIDFCDIKAYDLKASEAKKLLKQYKKKYKLYPSINDLWILAEEVGRKNVDKKFGEKPDKAKIALQTKDSKKSATSKEQRKKDLESKRNKTGEKEIDTEVEDELENDSDEDVVACIYCGFKNPIDSNKCKKCGKNI